MHIADGFISQPACVITTGLAAAGLGWAVTNVRAHASAEQLKLAPAVAAAVFAGQMVNFSMGTEMSGHLVGSALAAILLGPALAMLVMATVIGSQYALLGDGGITTLGANFLSMGAVGVLAANVIWNRLRTSGGNWAAAGVASWAAVLGGSVATTMAVSTSGIALDMLANHSLIGVAEAGITLVALVGLQSLSNIRKKIAALGLAAVGLLMISPLASTLPDGLEAALAGTTGTGHAIAGALVALPLSFLALRAVRHSTERKTAPVKVRR